MKNSAVLLESDSVATPVLRHIYNLFFVLEVIDRLFNNLTARNEIGEKSVNPDKLRV